MADHEICNKYSWINNELFERILSKQGDAIKIKQLDVQPAFGNGENFSSQLLKVNVEYFDKNVIRSIKLIIKATLGEKLVRSRDVFAKEICIYDEIIPQIETILESANISIKLTPKFYSGNLEQSYLILEDLTAVNYSTVARSQGLNLIEMKLCLKTLALWHAASFKLVNDKSLELYNLFMKPHVTLNGSPLYRTLFKNAISSCAEAFERNANCADISQKLHSLKANAFEKCCAAVERNQNDPNVLTHGDLWSNNIMFKDDDSEMWPLFLDFQMSYFGSPILDVSYLLFTSSNETITSNDFDELFDFYCEQLISDMIKLDISLDAMPSKQHLQSEFHLRGCYGAFFSLFCVPLRMYQPSMAQDDSSNDDVKKFLSSSHDGHDFRLQIYSNPQTQIVLENLLRYFIKKQFLN